MEDRIYQQYQEWLKNATEDSDLTEELLRIEKNEEEIYDRFYRELEFGTGGLRGVIGVGENRMNIYTVRRATQGLADYLLSQGPCAAVALSYDSRIKSDLFAKEAARVLAGNGIRAYLYPCLEPTPVLSYAVRALRCQAGIMITASHNPSKYNGYKCYGADGCQMTDHDAGVVTDHIRRVDIFGGVKVASYEDAVAAGQIRLIGDDVVKAFLSEVEKQQVTPGICRQIPLHVIYTPLNGTGNRPVREILDRIGVHVQIVPEQELPDGHFPTCPYPNPEIRQVFEKALDMAKETQPDLLLATDPDCDRVGIAVRDNGKYTLMSGNEVGCLLLNYLLSRRQEENTLPDQPMMVKTIVTSDLAARIAQKYGCRVVEVLTGFKYIGEQIGLLEKEGYPERYVFGFEESYGYLAGTYVRDKDAVVASMLICEMTAYYLSQGKTLLQVLESLYQEHGYFRHAQLNKAFEGAKGMEDMQQLMNSLRTTPPTVIAGKKVIRFADYLTSQETDRITGAVQPISLPKSNVLSFGLEGGAGFIVRPSGTEPKVKAYLTAVSESDSVNGKQEAEELMKRLQEEGDRLLTVTK